MVIWKEGKTIKKIPWSIFRLSELDWRRVLDVKDILEVSKCTFPLKLIADITIDRIAMIFNDISHQR